MNRMNRREDYLWSLLNSNLGMTSKHAPMIFSVLMQHPILSILSILSILFVHTGLQHHPAPSPVLQNALRNTSS